MIIGRTVSKETEDRLRRILDEMKDVEPEWYDALLHYNLRQIERICSICQQDDPRDIARQLRAEGFIRPAELTEEAMKQYPIYKDYFIH